MRSPLALALLAAVAVPPGSQAAGPGSSSNDVSCCLNGSSLSQRLLPTFGGDTAFFAAQTNDPPNVVFILDNSTSMYELPLAVVSKDPEALGVVPLLTNDEFGNAESS